MYTRRNSIESSAQHWCILLAAVVTAWLAWGPSGITINLAGVFVVIGLLAANALVVTLLAARAVRKEQSLAETMMWESVTTYVSLALVAGLIAVTGGLAAPTLFVTFLWAPYLGMSVEFGYTVRGLTLLLGGALGVAGWYTDSWASNWEMGALVGASLLFVVIVTYFYASDLYAERFTAEQLEAAVSARVEQISQVLVQAADGDLSMGVVDARAGHRDGRQRRGARRTCVGPRPDDRLVAGFGVSGAGGWGADWGVCFSGVGGGSGAGCCCVGAVVCGGGDVGDD